jgi:hypothetical protein
LRAGAARKAREDNASADVRKMPARSTARHQSSTVIRHYRVPLSRLKMFESDSKILDLEQFTQSSSTQI